MIARRGIGARGIDDLFDLAEALLTRESIQRALAPLDRPTLAALSVPARAGHPLTATEVADRLAELGAPSPDPAHVERALETTSDALLIERQGAAFACYQAVAERLSQWPEEGLPSAAELAATPSPAALSLVRDPAPDSRDDAADRAFACGAAIADLLTDLAVQPAQDLQKGGLSLPSVRRLAAASNLPTGSVPHALALAEHAGLVARRGRERLVTPEAARWLPLPTARRWRDLADAWMHGLDDAVRGLLADSAGRDWGRGLESVAAWSYPAAGNGLRERLDTALAEAELLGLHRDGRPHPIAALLFARGAEEASTTLADALPAEVEKVYVQHDLTIIAPGPLTPEVDSRLRAFADVEGHRLASSYRVTETSVGRAVAAGHRAADLLATLEEISLSGVPQPMEYLITETAERFGRVRVGALPAPAAAVRSPAVRSPAVRSMGGRAVPRSYVRSDDATLMRTIEVDRSLTPLGLTPDGHGALVSRFSRDDVFWALLDQHYPVAAEDEGRGIVPLRRTRVAGPRAEADAAGDDEAALLVARLREAERAVGPDAERAWFARQLEAAVRAKARVRVDVRMPDGTLAEYTLEPTGVGGGRVRGRDQGTDVERTLPLASIHAIHTV